MCAMAEEWNDAFEALPTGDLAVAILDDKIRELKVDIRERAQVEHNWSTHGTPAGTDSGTHKADIISLPGTIGVAYIGATAAITALANLNGKVAFDTTLYQPKMNTGSAWAIYSPVPTGFKTVVYADTAQTGWTLDNTLDDKVLFVTKGSAAGGDTGGSTHDTGTWTQPNHTHTGPSHVHKWLNIVSSTASDDQSYDSGGSAVDLGRAADNKASNVFTIPVEEYTKGPDQDYYTAAGGTGATGGDATANSWRPAAYCFTVQSKK
jgi:hypothetical protein